MELIIEILKAIWQEGGVPWWRIAIGCIILVAYARWMSQLAQRDHQNPFGNWLIKASNYIWILVVSMIILGAYGIMIPLLIFFFSSIGKVWKFLTHKDENGETEAQRLWAEVQSFLPEKEAPEEKK